MKSRSPLIFATRSGGTTIDRDSCGGNPFATALIELAGGPAISLRQFPNRLRALTTRASRGHQVPQWTAWPLDLDWHFHLDPGSRQERRCALVLIVSDYSKAGLPALGGAAHDERRISAMLAANGFSVVQGIAPTRAALLTALRVFSRLAPSHDAAVVYCSGHGIESRGNVYLLPGDYPVRRGCSADLLEARAVSIDRIAMACRASTLNIVFFAGCRTLASTMAAGPAVSRKRR